MDILQPSSQMKPARITGVVVKVDTRIGSTPIHIFLPNQQKKLSGYCHPNMPLQIGDRVSGNALISEEEQFHFHEAPAVVPSVMKDDLINLMVVGGAVRSATQGQRCYDLARKAIENDVYRDSGSTIEEEVAAHLDRLAQSWSDKGQKRTLQLLGLPVEEGKRFLTAWHTNSNVRRLALLGLTEEQFKDCYLSCVKIFNKCRINPYSIPMVSLDQCYRIVNQYQLKLAPETQICGEIVRLLWRNTIQSAWSCTPLFLLKKYQLNTLLPILEEQYGVIRDQDSLYLEDMHRIESELAQLVAKKVKADTETNSTPCQLSENSSPDQVAAIQGAVNHLFSIVTGTAGTGKCLGKGTLLQLYGGGICPVERIGLNQLLCGPDSRPRRVLSLAQGRDLLYRIVPAYGESFVCNQEHLLTLRGRPARCYGQEVLFTVHGRPQRRRFGSEEEARQYCESLGDDIFDLSVREYLTQESNCQLYYQGVNYPAAVFTEPLVFPLPDCFKYNLASVRLRLLQHLVEKYGDNYPDHGECQLSEQIEGDFRFLASSLGLPHWIRADRGCVTWSEQRYHFRSFTVRALGEGQYYGFQLDGDGRFLLHDGLVTHNTTCLAQLARNLDLRKIKYLICSFTGKAVSRLREATGLRTPATIHRLIARAKKGEEEKYTHLIIDEASMVTAALFHELLSFYPDIEKITLFGDDYQLEPIQWGSLFQQLIKSETVPVYRLTVNHRLYPGQDPDGILYNSRQMIAHSSSLPLSFMLTNNFMIIEGKIDRVFDIVQACFSSGLKAHQLTVLSSYNRDLAELNSTFQSIYNMNGRSVTRKGIKWMVGDKVMMTVNDPIMGVYNGETGLLKSISDTELEADFGPAGCHFFPFKGTKADKTVDVLTHGYALTIDKSQGSEWDFVILYAPKFDGFINRNRLFTAITRAKRAIWLVVSSRKELEEAAVRSPARRYENLSKRLESVLPKRPVVSLEGGDDDLPDERELDYPDVE